IVGSHAATLPPTTAVVHAELRSPPTATAYGPGSGRSKPPILHCRIVLIGDQGRRSAPPRGPSPARRPGVRPEGRSRPPTAPAAPGACARDDPKVHCRETPTAPDD